MTESRADERSLKVAYDTKKKKKTKSKVNDETNIFTFNKIWSFVSKFQITN